MKSDESNKTIEDLKEEVEKEELDLKKTKLKSEKEVKEEELDLQKAKIQFEKKRYSTDDTDNELRQLQYQLKKQEIKHKINLLKYEKCKKIVLCAIFLLAFVIGIPFLLWKASFLQIDARLIKLVDFSTKISFLWASVVLVIIKAGLLLVAMFFAYKILIRFFDES